MTSAKRVASRSVAIPTSMSPMFIVVALILLQLARQVSRSPEEGLIALPHNN